MKPWKSFQEGDYPIQQIIFVNMDSVLGSLFTGPLLKAKYGSIDIMHQLRADLTPSSSDLEMLLSTRLPVVSTCWDADRLLRVLPAYLVKRGWPKGSVRVYDIGSLVFPTN